MVHLPQGSNCFQMPPQYSDCVYKAKRPEVLSQELLGVIGCALLLAMFTCILKTIHFLPKHTIFYSARTYGDILEFVLDLLPTGQGDEPKQHE